MIPLPDKKYSIIYADPPWSYQNRGTRAAASKHYDTMTIEDIKRMGECIAGALKDTLEKYGTAGDKEKGATT